MSGNERRNRKVFRRCWNDCRVDALTMYSGSEFQMEQAAAGKARLPTVDSLTDGTMRRLVAAERRVRRPGTRNVGDACERSQVSRRATMKNSVTQHGDLVLYALRYPQPMKANERISDVIGALQVEDQPCRRVQHRLESAQEVGWPPVTCCNMLCKKSRQTNLSSFRNWCNNARLESVCFLYACLMSAISWFTFFSIVNCIHHYFLLSTVYFGE